MDQDPGPRTDQGRRTQDEGPRTTKDEGPRTKGYVNTKDTKTRTKDTKENLSFSCFSWALCVSCFSWLFSDHHTRHGCGRTIGASALHENALRNSGMFETTPFTR
jgi:hypothetical protein